MPRDLSCMVGDVEVMSLALIPHSSPPSMIPIVKVSLARYLRIGDNKSLLRARNFTLIVSFERVGGIFQDLISEKRLFRMSRIKTLTSRPILYVDL